jgi:transposase
VGRSRGGRTTKLVAIADKKGLPVSVVIDSGQRHDIKLVEPAIEEAFGKVPAKLIGDTAFDSDPIDARLAKNAVELITPHKSNRKRKKTQDGRALRRYCRRWRIENLFAQLKRMRRITNRWEFKAENYLAFVLLGCVKLLLRGF